MATILIADDNPHAHRMAEEILAPEGHHVTAVFDGNAAISRINELKPDLVLLDVKMPEADGLSVCRNIRSTPDLDGVRVVMLSSALEPFDGNGSESGFDSVLQKPLDADSLLSTVNGLLDGSSPSVAIATIGDPLADLVEETLGDKVPADEIRAAVEEVLLSALPDIIDRITERVADTLKP